MTYRQLFNKWVILGAVCLAGLLLLITILSIGSAAPLQPADGGLASANLTMIPASTSTSGAPPTPTIDPFAPTPIPEGIAIGSYVQITGTQGDGLRIRSEPGLTGTPDFLGYDSEVFIVKDGPKIVDGYTWWYLVAPYDNTRAGWAAADFLSFIPAP